MKTGISNSAKRVISLVLAFAMLVGTLFTANIGINIKADAAAENTKTFSNPSYWSGNFTNKTTKAELIAALAQNGETGTSWNDAIIIDSADELATLVRSSANKENDVIFTTKMYFKVSDSIDALVMQPSSVIDIQTIAGYNDYSQVQKFFDESSSAKNWMNGTSGAIFDGNFDGNGVPIYGLYANGIAISKSNAICQNASLFSFADGNATFKNVVIKNSYFKSVYRAGALFSCAFGTSGGAKIDGTINVSGCEVSGCYMYSAGTTSVVSGATVTDYSPSATGVLVGELASDKLCIDACFVYNNYAFCNAPDYDDGNPRRANMAIVGLPVKEGSTISNTICVGTEAYNGWQNLTKLTYSNVYAKVNKVVDGVENIFDVETTIGSRGMKFLENLTWATEGTADNDGVWYASEGQYPTPIKPDNWDSSITPADNIYSRGKGTEKEPYIIRTVDQLYAMVHEYNVGFNHRTITNWDFYDPYYYKVDNDIKALYINDVTTMEEVKALAEAGVGNVWKLTPPTATGGANTDPKNYGFFGNFDGNGVTIYGLISTDGTGFVYRLKGNSAIKNVNFEAAYSKGSDKASVVTTNLGTWNIINDDCHTISNVAVRNAYVEKTGSFAAKDKFRIGGGNFKLDDKTYVDSYEERFGQYDHTKIIEPGKSTHVLTEEKSKTTNSDSTITVVQTITYTDYIETKTTKYKADGTTEVSTSSSYDFYVYDKTTGANVYTTNGAGAAGLVSTTDTPGLVFTITNCLFDGNTSQLVNSGTCTTANTTTATVGLIDNRAGILSQNSDANNISVSNCVSLGGYSVYPDEVVASDGTRLHYNRFGFGLGKGYQWGSSFKNCYTDKAVPTYNGTDYTQYYAAISEMRRVTATTAYEKLNMPRLSWGKNWQLETFGSTTIPMPMISSGDSSDDYSSILATQLDGKGASTNSGVSGFNGKYGWQTLFTGSGTEKDPYLITDALGLARAIGSGGESMDYPLYYKLACDIDLEGATWLGQTPVGTSYAYVPFTGTLDGAGYSVSNFAATDDNAAGLIPVLDGGTVKDLHIRNAYAGSPVKAGLIAGEVKAGSTIAGCSVEGSEAVAATTVTITGDENTADVSDSYYVVENEDETKTQEFVGMEEPTTLYSSRNPNATWYKGPDGVIRPVSFAKAHSVTDVDGDGIINETYLPTDAVALRRALVKNENYLNIYGDVNNSGETNISDLAILRYEMADKDYFDMRDGFWRALETRQINIYYGENDNYDAARKLELYLESMVPRLDMNKIVVVSGNDAWGTQGEGTYVHDKNIAILSDGNIYRADKTAKDGFEDLEKSAKYALDGTLQIVVGDIGTQYAYEDSAEYYNYEISYDAEKLALWLKGGSFTAVEQAVLDFIANAKPENGEKGIYTVENGSILDKKAYESLKSDGAASSQSYKQAVEVDGTTYYYAWGDEFEGTNTTINSAEWQVRNYKYEEGTNGDTGVNNTPASAATTNGNYHNLTSPTVDAVKDLWEVNNGKLTIWRGVNVDAADISELSSGDQAIFNSGEYTWGYKGVSFKDDVDSDGQSSFGKLVDAQDVFVDPGLIQTQNTMLFKQGYAEMRAALPSDGHAFPAWWFYNGTNEHNNANYDRILYGKVYEENAAWQTNKAEKVIPGTLSTYKYKAPKAYLEFDIVEFMEGQNAEADATYKTQGLTRYYTQKGIATGKYLSYPQLTIHKNYSLHSTGKTGADDIAISVPNWSDNSLITNTYSNFHNISGDAINNHRYQHIDKYDRTWSGNKLVKKGFTYPNSSNGVDGTVAGAYHIKGGVTKYWTYGFSWWVNESNNTYELTIYVDFNEDGIMQADEKVVVVNQDVDHYHDNDIVRSRGLGEEAKVWNQYAYMLIDNAFYTSNTLGTRTKRGLTGDWSEWAGVTPYTDLLQKGNSSAYDTSYADKATFDIEYVRVYQENDKRDIVTPETEDFNNSNHFGY